MNNNLIIRVNKIKDLILSCNIEKVYFIFHHGTMVFNGLDYDVVSDKFNSIVNN
jgi:hypothetical protein